jgi:hypothetical protein
MCPAPVRQIFGDKVKAYVQEQVYKTLIRPVVTYRAETWTLTLTEGNILRILERKMMRKIYGPVMEITHGGYDIMRR